LLRNPLFGLAKRHIQPKRYPQLVLNVLDFFKTFKDKYCVYIILTAEKTAKEVIYGSRINIRGKTVKVDDDGEAFVDANFAGRC
jgi:hypothetical protein